MSKSIHWDFIVFPVECLLHEYFIRKFLMKEEIWGNIVVFILDDTCIYCKESSVYKTAPMNKDYTETPVNHMGIPFSVVYR